MRRRICDQDLPTASNPARQKMDIHAIVVIESAIKGLRHDINKLDATISSLHAKIDDHTERIVRLETINDGD